MSRVIFLLPLVLLLPASAQEQVSVTVTATLSKPLTLSSLPDGCACTCNECVPALTCTAP